MWDLLKEPSSHGFQVVVLTWVDAKSRLDRLKDRMDFLLERLDLDPVPVFACKGSRLGLLVLAELAGRALDCKCAVFNRGQHVHARACPRTCARTHGAPP